MNLTYGNGAALVTGGSGGIGSAIVRTLARAGVPVGFTYHKNREGAARTAAESNSTASAGDATGHASGRSGRAGAYPWSYSGADSATDLLARVEADLGPVRFVVGCAGIAQEVALFRLPESEWVRILETNLSAHIALVRAAIGPMLKASFGRIVLISSVSGLRGIPGHTVYAASKGGLDAFARSLAKECAAFGVTVNSAAPGYIDTPMLDSVSAERKKALTGGIPLRRLGSPDDVAHVVAFLLSEQAAYVTGQTWAVDGGLSS